MRRGHQSTWAVSLQCVICNSYKLYRAFFKGGLIKDALSCLQASNCFNSDVTVSGSSAKALYAIDTTPKLQPPQEPN